MENETEKDSGEGGANCTFSPSIYIHSVLTASKVISPKLYYIVAASWDLDIARIYL